MKEVSRSTRKRMSSGQRAGRRVIIAGSSRARPLRWIAVWPYAASDEQLAHRHREPWQQIFPRQQVVGAEERGRAVRTMDTHLDWLRIEDPHKARAAGQISGDLLADLDIGVARRDDLNCEVGRDGAIFVGRKQPQPLVPDEGQVRADHAVVRTDTEPRLGHQQAAYSVGIEVSAQFDCELAGVGAMTDLAR